MIRMLLTLAATAAAMAAAEPAVRVRVQGTVREIPLERYVAGVVTGESSVFRSDAALRAVAVAARTYAVRARGRHAAEGFDFCDTTHCQRFQPNGVPARVTSAASDTAGEFLWFEGKPAFTVYTRDCGGRGEAAVAVWPDQGAPYLTSHEDPYCVRAGSSAWQWSGDVRQIGQAFVRSSLRAPQTIEAGRVEQRTSSGRARTVALSGAGGTVRISAGSLRFAIGRDLGWNTVLSDWFDVHAEAGRLIFQGRGSGHGVGLCQRGADQMGVEGRSYREILAFYYPGTAIGRTAAGIAWQRICGAQACLETTEPSRDGSVLAAIERQIAWGAQRTGWPTPGGIVVRAYPDLDTFRNATAEPGWVAARTTGRRIDLQPVETLRRRGALDSTLRHELLHVFVESVAAADLPLWFREGIALWLEGEAHGEPAPRLPSDQEFRRANDPARVRRAYDDAARTVAWLATRYGETAVLDWVKRGLPVAVKNTIASQAAANKPQATAARATKLIISTAKLADFGVQPRIRNGAQKASSSRTGVSTQ
jgi:stage II sporulation protein D